jgi:phospholipase C
MNRRTFLKATGAAAAGPLLGAEMGRVASPVSQIEHVVLVMMENRSFDHFLDGFQTLTASRRASSMWITSERRIRRFR